MLSRAFQSIGFSNAFWVPAQSNLQGGTYKQMGCLHLVHNDTGYSTYDKIQC